MTNQPPIPSVNFHLWKACNMRCRFCFAKFQRDDVTDIVPKGHLPPEKSLRVVEILAESGLEKISFAGGEPTLCPWLPDLIRRAKELGMTTSIVTNGSRLTPEYLENLVGVLDWVTLSIDSLDTDVNTQTGRALVKGALGEEEYRDLVTLVREQGFRLKINTVVTNANRNEDMTGFIRWARPERWKIFQVLPMAGQNDDTLGNLPVNNDEFMAYTERHLLLTSEGIIVVPESNDLMTGSYLMVDPAGRFFDNTKGRHTYSKPILDVGVTQALRQVTVDPTTFTQRGGHYD